MIEQIREKARELLESDAVDCAIGYERATDGITARPCFAYRPEEVERFIFDETCVHNLAPYLMDRRAKVNALVAKPCDARAINLLLQEQQLERDRLFIIGVVCSGVVETGWNRAGKSPASRCATCPQHTPPIYDFLVGDPVAEEAPPAVTSPEVADLEAMGAESRRSFWEDHFGRCLRCYACRQACPGCYCKECFVDRLEPLWVGIRIAPVENHMWNAIRAFHLAGRCIECGECERVCPVNIPLMLLNSKLSQETAELFDFQPGLSAEAQPPLATFSPDEDL
jgi:ferredoxin